MGHDPEGRNLARIKDLKDHLRDPTCHNLKEATINNLWSATMFAEHDTLELVHRFHHHLMQKKWHRIRTKA